MGDLAPEEWQSLDEWLYRECRLPAIKAYRERTGASFQVAVDAVNWRDQVLRSRYPERFKTDEDRRREAFERLRAITSRIHVIEGSWDGDSEGWFIRLSAITDEPSAQHPRYTEHGLYFVREWDRMLEVAEELGTQLARSAGVEFFLTDRNRLNPDEEKRWWNEPSPEAESPEGNGPTI